MPAQINLAGPAELPGLSYVPTGGLIIYVHYLGAAALDRLPAGMYSSDLSFATSINQALSYCRANRGDTILVLPGHVESISGANGWSNLVAGVAIRGIGWGNMRPTITWTATGSTVTLNQANVTLDNFILNLMPGTGAVVVTAPITISAAANKISNCDIFVGADVNNYVTNGITTTAGATDLVIEDTNVYGDPATLVGSVLKLVGAVRHILRRCRLRTGSAATTAGPILFATTASTGFLWEDVAVGNTKTAGATAVTGMAANQGYCRNVNLYTLSNDDLAHAWLTLANVQFGSGCTITNNIGESGGVAGPVST